mgnify:CR=1 FL=1
MVDRNENFKLIYVNSSDRIDSYSDSSDFNIYIPDLLLVSQVRIVDARIPHTWYNVDIYNNKIDFDEGSGELSATITPGQYTTSTLAVEVKTALETAGTLTYNVAFDTSSTFKSSIGVTTGSVNLLWETGTHAGETIGPIMGFLDINTGVAASHTSDSVYNLNILDYILIKSSTFGGGNYNNIATTNYEDAGTSILAAVKINTNFGSMQHLNDGIQYPSLARTTGPATVINLQLKTHDDTYLYLNGQEWSCLLQIDMNTTVVL